MTSPFALVLSIAATGCGFIIALVGLIADAASAPPPTVAAAMPPGTGAVVAPQVRHGDPVPYTVAWEPAASRPQATV